MLSLKCHHQSRYMSSYGAFVQLECIRMRVSVYICTRIVMLIDMVAFVYGYNIHDGMYFTAIIAVFHATPFIHMYTLTVLYQCLSQCVL